MGKKKLSAAYLASFCNELNMILASGISVDDGMEMISEDEKDAGQKDALVSMSEKLRNGSTLYETLREAERFPEYMLNMVKLGEKAGTLEHTLGALGTYYAKQVRLKKSISSAVLYPAVLLVMMIIVVGILVIKVLPVFGDVYAQLGTTMSPLAVALMNIGVWMGKNWILMIAILVGIAAVIVCLAKIPAISKRLFFRRTREKVGESRFADVMEVALASGMDMDEALGIAMGMNAGTVMEKRSAVCKSALDKGEPLEKALSEAGIFSNMERRMFTVGVRTGCADEAMKKIAEDASEGAEEAVDRLVGKAEPTMVIVMSVIVGIVLLSVMIPLLGVMSALG